MPTGHFIQAVKDGIDMMHEYKAPISFESIFNPWNVPKAYAMIMK
jgi:hypothetical protein